MRTRAVAAATAVLGLAGLLMALTALWPRTDTGSPIPVAGPGPSAALEQRAPEPPYAPTGRRDATTAPAKRQPMPPVRVRIGSAGLDSAVKPVGVSRDGQMALPADPKVLGWYSFGPPPGGGSGSVVLAGHLDSTRFGIGPLVGLREVDPGDEVGVTRSDGTRGRYTVVDVHRYPKQALPSALFARTGPERLRIITCGGDFQPGNGGYQENLVVTAVPR
jgi:hypothetical protein